MLTINQAALSFDSSGGNQSVSLVANKVWSASSSRSWCKVSPSSGDGSDNSKFTLSVSCDANTTYDERSCTITVVCEEMTKVIAVTQVEREGLEVLQQTYNVSFDNQQIDILVNSNISVQVDVDSPWISYIGSKALGSSVLSFQIEENESEERQAIITLRGESIRVNVDVHQAAHYVDFDDISFKQYCISNYDKNSDGNISIAEAKAIETIVVCTDNISSLKGIEYMENLQSLRCCGSTESVFSNGQLVERKEYGRLISLDVSNNLLLTHLLCSGNKLTELDIRNNTQLKELYCYHNQLTALDISRNIELQKIWCEMNYISSLDLKSNTELQNLDCSNNNLSILDVSNCYLLSVLLCVHNDIQELALNNNPDLFSLSCDFTLLSSLDVSNNLKLGYLSCHNNPYLTEIWLKKNQTINSLYFDQGVATIRYKD